MVKWSWLWVFAVALVLWPLTCGLWSPEQALEHLQTAPNQRTNITLDGRELCQMNCEAADRLVNSTRPTDTRPYPWAIAPYPTKNKQFCKLGCELFFTEVPNNVSCKANCDWYYRFDSTEEYSNLAVTAKLECYDGCDIAYTVCQSGYYCVDGSMLPCPIGTYREAVTKPLLKNSSYTWNLQQPALKSVRACIGCPTGKFRGLLQGKSTEDCSKCPKGKYSDRLGATYVTDCIRCPAGKFGEYEGVSSCTCIDTKSCDLSVTIKNVGEYHYYKSSKKYPYGVDYYRESVPYIGRW